MAASRAAAGAACGTTSRARRIPAGWLWPGCGRNFWPLTPERRSSSSTAGLWPNFPNQIARPRSVVSEAAITGAAAVSGFCGEPAKRWRASRMRCNAEHAQGRDCRHGALCRRVGRTLRYHASHASQGFLRGRKLSATLIAANGLTSERRVVRFNHLSGSPWPGGVNREQGVVVHSLECAVSVRNRPWSQLEFVS